MPAKYDEATKAKAVRPAVDHRDDYDSERAAMKVVSSRLGTTAETLCHRCSDEPVMPMSLTADHGDIADADGHRFVPVGNDPRPAAQHRGQRQRSVDGYAQGPGRSHYRPPEDGAACLDFRHSSDTASMPSA